MSEPRTEAGRALLDGSADALGITSDSALGAHGEQYRERFHEALQRGIRAIEDEAAREAVRKERERISSLPRWTKGMEAVGGEWIRVAAITDTGEEAAS